MQNYITDKYSLVWDDEKKIIFSTLFEAFDYEGAVDFKRDAIRMVEEVRASGFPTVSALHDISRLPLSYRLDHKTQAVLMDVMERVDRVGAVGPQPNAKELLLNFFNTASFLWQQKKSVYFLNREEALQWLVEQNND